jgi:hypothetical protein
MSDAINLAGKDYFTVREAAAYACVSYSHWRARIQREFPAADFCGKLIYRRADVQRYIEQKMLKASLGLQLPRFRASRP